MTCMIRGQLGLPQERKQKRPEQRLWRASEPTEVRTELEVLCSREYGHCTEKDEMETEWKWQRLCWDGEGRVGHTGSQAPPTKKQRGGGTRRTKERQGLKTHLSLLTEYHESEARAQGLRRAA